MSDAAAAPSPPPPLPQQQTQYLRESDETAETADIALELPFPATSLSTATHRQFLSQAAIPARSNIQCFPRMAQAPAPPPAPPPACKQIQGSCGFKSLHCFMIPKGCTLTVTVTAVTHTHPPRQQSHATSFSQKKQDRWFQIASNYHDSLAPHCGSKKLR